MPVCSFCKKRYEFPRGLTLALNDGRLLHFCTSKCRKNLDMGRDNRKVKWINKTNKKEIAVQEKPAEKPVEKEEVKKEAEEKK